MKSFITILIAIIFCIPTSWGQNTERPRKQHADMFVYLKGGDKLTGLLYKTTDDAILLMPFNEMDKKKRQFFLTGSSVPVRIPISKIQRIVIKPNFYAKGYGIGVITGAAATLAGMGVVSGGNFRDFEFIGPPVMLIGTFAVAPIYAALHRNSNKFDVLLEGNIEKYERIRSSLDKFIYFPNTDYEKFVPQERELLEISSIKK